MMRLKDKVAVITGGASGMGRATALRFLAEGASVVIADYNAETGADAMKEAADQGFGERTRFVRTDVAVEEQVENMIAAAVDAFGHLDIVFNNAGVGGAIGPLGATRVEDWDYTFDVLVKGVFLGVKHATQVMQAQGRGGAIINTASVAGLSGDAGPIAYSAAKAAVINLTRGAAVELAPDRIRVNAICPGFIPTRGAEALVGSLPRFADRVPIGQFPKPPDIGPIAVFLASAASDYMNGEYITIDSGGLAGGFAPTGYAPSIPLQELSRR
jgi:NAD(P)-dependent dehydrogenase (short-subunit alcohol dehydrogenase family)